MDHIIAKLTRAEIIQRNSNLKKAARERLSKMEHKPRADHRQPNRKKAASLEIRMADYSRMMDTGKHETKVSIRMDGGGFHRPGSLNK